MSSGRGETEEDTEGLRPRPSRRDDRLERLVSEVVERVDEAHRPVPEGRDRTSLEFDARFDACDELVDGTRAPEVPALGQPAERARVAGAEAGARPSIWRRLLRVLLGRP